ncbi:hypothetical protein GCM10009630_17560 [Kribbella jejuensis]|uniref:Uncharacterized protein n=1 Tax=Kribbella jejuensis TaxID=236068 RepID=A0A542ELQ5_9ACTN|nr:hypothetical protein [Kribbella jejuensis]TQJ16272.1 hypothetical protein FB475_0365 [Kribbella jejuensis]
MLRRRDTVHRNRRSEQVQVGLDELFWPGVSTVDESDVDIPNDAAEDPKEPEPAGATLGVAFFGWLVASGTSVLLMALVGAVCAWIGWEKVQDWASGWFFVGLWALLVVSLGIGAFSGGYAGGRMVPAHGARQGLEVWLFSWCAAAVLAGVGYLAVRHQQLVANIEWPTLPVPASDRTRAALLASTAVLLITLIGAVLGGTSANRK